MFDEDESESGSVILSEEEVVDRNAKQPQKQKRQKVRSEVASDEMASGTADDVLANKNEPRLLDFEDEDEEDKDDCGDLLDQRHSVGADIALGKRSHFQRHDDKLTQSFKKFHSSRRNKVFQSLNEAEQERFNSHMEAFGDKIRSSVEQFIAQLPGMKPKLAPHVSQLITSSAKIHAGQLVEHARQIQIEEIQNKLAIEHPHSDSELDTSPSDEPPIITKFGVLGIKATEKLQSEIENNLGPIQPWHMREARRKMIQNDEYISSAPKSMFLRK